MNIDFCLKIWEFRIDYCWKISIKDLYDELIKWSIRRIEKLGYSYNYCLDIKLLYWNVYFCFYVVGYSMRKSREV